MADSKEKPQKIKFGEEKSVLSARVKERRRKRERALQFWGSVVLFLLAFILLSAFSVLTIYLNDPLSWRAFLTENFTSVIYMEVCFFFLFVVLFCFYSFEKRKALYAVKDVLCVLLILLIGIVADYFTGRYVHIFARPVVLAPLLVCILRDKREAIVITFLLAMILFIMDYFTNFYGSGMNYYIFTSFILSVACGAFAVFVSGFVKSRIKMLAIGFLLCIPAEVIVGVFWLTQGYSYASYEFVEVLVYAAIAMIFSSLLFMALLPVFEITFSALTAFRLRELTSFDVKLLKRLREEAPATFDHSMVVAQFAEMCAADIGENAELARAAAYYHDVGKLYNPTYFTENQKGGVNPHDFIPPEVSVEVIRTHTRFGKELIKKNRLPDFFGEVAFRHHGTMPIRFFFVKAKSMSDGDTVDIKEYSYQDSKPLNKITAIIMLCDSCEAAIRAFRDNVARQRSLGGAVTDEAITKGIETIVKKIVDERIELDQFSECDITMRELGVISTSILNSATGVYHGRVAYPELNLKKRK